jgi:hypothetical protein
MRNISNLRLIFVQMLFALTIGQIALKTGDLYIYSGGNIWLYHYAYLHIILSIVILSTSWVGWQLSQSLQNSEKINSVFSLQYIILLLDIFLVIAYFMIVRCVEINDDHTIGSPNVNGTIFWTMIIFSGYAIWDIITKGIKLSYVKQGDKYLKITSTHINPLLKRIWPTLFCLIISLLFYKYLPEEPSPNKSSLIYIILICLFLFFRGLKQEVKRTYKLQKDQIPESLRNEDMIFPLPIIETKYKFKIFMIKFLPGTLLLISIVIYFYY